MRNFPKRMREMRSKLKEMQRKDAKETQRKRKDAKMRLHNVELNGAVFSLTVINAQN